MSFNYSNIRSIIEEKFHKARIFVVGDIMLDRYIWGEVDRISPEAPVPVVRIRKRTEVLGGAGNVANNLVSLGTQCYFMGICGEDTFGQQVRNILEQKGVIDHLHIVHDRPTTVKSRVITKQQQMIRLDEEEIGPISGTLVSSMLEDAVNILGKVDLLVISDYAKGLLVSEFLKPLIQEACKREIPVLVDPKGNDYEKYRGATIISPNRKELFQAAHTFIDGEDKLIKAAQGLAQRYEIKAVLVTRSEEGMTLIFKDEVSHLPARAREVFDVSGAGDTVIATMAAGIACGLSFKESASLSNEAAGIVVGKIGTAPIHREELLNALWQEDIEFHSNKVCNVTQIIERVAIWRRQGQRIAFTNGCFDLLHAGHIMYLEKARMTADRLIVGLNTDRSITAIKGPARPIVHQEDRARILAALASVDAVILFDEETPIKLIQQISPDVLVKGADYAEDQVVGGDWVKSSGGKVVLVPLLNGRSSTGLIERISELNSYLQTGRGFS